MAEEKTQAEEAVEAKRGSGFLSKIQRVGGSGRKKGIPLDLTADEKRGTLDSSAPLLVHSAHTEGPSSIPPPDAKRLSALFPSLSKSSDLLLPAAPAIATTRLPSENGILDVIRTLGLSQAVSATTLSQYTRCMPPTLAGPLPRSPRGSLQGGMGMGGGVGCCAKLHCEGCHMDVMMLDHHKWDERVDGEVFREFYPEVQRLRASLIASVGSRAYCCACSWVDVKGPVMVEDAVQGKQRELQWVCAGHQ